MEETPKKSAYQLYQEKKEKNLTDAEFKELLKDNKVIVCKTCLGSGITLQGGSFGGETRMVNCHCKFKFKK